MGVGVKVKKVDGKKKDFAILAGGNPDHPSFASLPPANPNAHLH